MSDERGEREGGMGREMKKSIEKKKESQSIAYSLYFSLDVFVVKL